MVLYELTSSIKFGTQFRTSEAQKSRKTSSKWLHPVTLLIMASYHKCMPVNFKTFFWIGFTTKSNDGSFQIDKITFLCPEFLEIMGILWVAITMKGIVSPRQCIGAS